MITDNDKFITMRYSFISPLDGLDEARFITKYTIELTLDDECGIPIDTIGKAEMRIISMNLIEASSFNITDVFDSDHDVFRIASVIYDFVENDFNKEILDFFEDFIICGDLCFIHHLELLPDYRRQGIGKKMIKDIVNHFSSSCDLFVAETFPMQFEKISNIEADDWYQKMRYDLLDKDFEKSDYLLKAFYQSVGFQYIENYPDLMFLNASKKNEILDEIIPE
jgi:GNAT superfamily N-acetyltransferase